jgi:formamidopyrimidine-DNA glycosylase
MPELPEVETIRRQLAPRLEGRVLDDVGILDARWTRPGPPAVVEAGLRGRRVERLERRGKYFDWVLDGDGHLLVHLRMTGTLLYDAPAEPLHTRVRFTLDDGHELLFVDPRRFGTGHLLEGTEARDASIAARLGVEPFGPEFTGAALRERARGRRVPVKSFLLDQRNVAGVGNIYADEALHRAGIHPLRPVGKLTLAQLDRLRDTVVSALEAGLEAGGATIDDYRDVDGARGAFQDEFLVHLRAGRPCLTCGTLVRKLVVGGRGTYVCERCQPRPRLRRAVVGKVRVPGGVKPS